MPTPWPQHLNDRLFTTREFLNAAWIDRGLFDMWSSRGFIEADEGGGKGVTRKYSFKSVYQIALITALTRNGLDISLAAKLVRAAPVIYHDDRVNYFLVDPVVDYGMSETPIHGRYFSAVYGPAPEHEPRQPQVADLFGRKLTLIQTSPRGTTPPPAAPGKPIDSVLVVNVSALVERIVRAVEPVPEAE